MNTGKSRQNFMSWGVQDHLSVCVFVCARYNLELFSVDRGYSGLGPNCRFNCWLIDCAKLTENAKLMGFDGVSASSTTSARCKLHVLNNLTQSESEGISDRTGFCTDLLHSTRLSGRSRFPSRANRFRTASLRGCT